MHCRAFLIVLGLGWAAFVPAQAQNTGTGSSNPNVKAAMKKAKKVRPGKYQAPKKSKKPARVTYGARKS